MGLLNSISQAIIARAEKRLGVSLDYVRKIAHTNTRLLMRYNRIFGFLDPNHYAPKEAYHAARLRGALAADCGTCVEAEINLAKDAGLDGELINQIIMGKGGGLSVALCAVIALADSVVRNQEDAPEARETIVKSYGDAALIELAYAMNGAALLPGIKRTMGYATACNLDLMQKIAKSEAPNS